MMRRQQADLRFKEATEVGCLGALQRASTTDQGPDFGKLERRRKNVWKISRGLSLS